MNQPPSPAEVDFNILPSVAFTGRDRLPDEAAIYFVLSDDNVLYIGAATSLVRRWRGKNHHRSSQVGEFPNARIAWIVTDVTNLASLERRMIGYFNPSFNRSIFGGGRFVVELPLYTTQRLDGILRSTKLTKTQLMIVMVDRMQIDLAKSKN